MVGSTQGNLRSCSNTPKLTPFFYKVKRVKEFFFSFRGDRKTKKRVSVLKNEEKVEDRFLDGLN